MIDVVKFRCIMFSGCREEVENVSVNQRPRQQASYSDRQKTDTYRRTLRSASCQVSSNCVH